MREIDTNGVSVIALSTLLARHFAEQGRGCLAVIGSVAGDRGRQSNYVYGAAKGLVDIFLQGLRNRLAKQGVQVLTIKPGFVDTPMTAAFAKGALWSAPPAIHDFVVFGVIATEHQDLAGGHLGSPSVVDCCGSRYFRACRPRMRVASGGPVAWPL